MDILWALLTLPYAPVRGLTAVVKVIAREAESQQHNPVNIRRELEELDRAAAAGEISPRERDRAQQRVLERLTGPTSAPGRAGSRAATAGFRDSAGSRDPGGGSRGAGAVRRQQPPVRRRTGGRRGEQQRGRGR